MPKAGQSISICRSVLWDSLCRLRGNSTTEGRFRAKSLPIAAGYSAGFKLSLRRLGRFVIEAARGHGHSYYFFAVKIFALRISARNSCAPGGGGTWPSSTA